MIDGGVVVSILMLILGGTYAIGMILEGILSLFDQ